MPQDPELNPDEIRLAEMLRALDVDLPQPDPAFLDALRQRALDEFLVDSETPVLISQPESDPTLGTTTATATVTDTQNHSQPTPSAPAARTWRQAMFAFAFRGTLAASAALVMFAAWFTSVPVPPLRAAVPFSEVLDELREAKSLHLELVKDGAATEVWVRAPGLVRMEDSPKRYRIAAGSRLWKIDESANTVAESDSPWFLDPDQHINLLGLLELGIQDASELLSARPVAEKLFDGKKCLVYRVDLPAENGKIEVEALAEVGTKQLVALLARRAGPADDVNRQGGNRLGADAQPLAELKLIALNAAVADDKFVVSKSLTEDGRIGTIRDPQGIVTLRPMLAKRWTPLCRETALKPGDWLRTELRGANAVKVVLSSDAVLTLGPGSQLEVISPTQARLHTGEVQVALSAKPTAFELLAPRQVGHRKFMAEGKTLVRVDRDEQLVDVPQQPKWLTGFEGTSNNESLGSLIVKLPDGRNEPLTVGYHKVSVEIRDQIARTTIEESFVNHTITQLEGVFHFPLPQDASISGFGMWIGNELVEADVVEKQRAREIYETILREKRDPGLLEWTGGNIFKARVFPIEARSEKRIKIVYTQVLPLRGNRYRYSYGLRSELLRTKPLRELAISVTVNSALPLKEIACPTHAARRQLTAHSGQIEFAAQEYTPTRDFEVVCDIDGTQSDVVAIPHRRGDDGYLLIQVTPPTLNGKLLNRDVVPDGKPLQLVLVCDTSSSMDSEKRKQQAEFIATVLSSLGENDRFSLVAADVNPVWASTQPLAPTAANVESTQKFLAERVSLGWTDLDRAFSDLLKKAPADAQIVYIGDGIVTAGDSDPAAFVNRLGRLFHSSNSNPDAAVKASSRGFHAVTVGNSYESVVLKGIAALGGGSVRSISGEQTPQTIALELLNEIAQPGLRDLKVEFKGLKVAAVYPDRLPNIAAGTQQILVGRYLPEGKEQHGEIIVTGSRGTEVVRYSAKVTFPEAETGNSFIPRLWARSHLDHLLNQGSSAAVRDDIIRLSEEFHIITPYTSLLVLESDADRERFGVQRRYEMRDGERFFAQGRANANFELVQQQMKLAGNWRQGIRRQFLRGWAGLGRNSKLFQLQAQQLQRMSSRLSELSSQSRIYNSSSMNDINWSGGAEGEKGEWATVYASQTPFFETSTMSLNIGGVDGGMPSSGFGGGGGFGGDKAFFGRTNRGDSSGHMSEDLLSLGDGSLEFDAQSNSPISQSRAEGTKRDSLSLGLDAIDGLAEAARVEDSDSFRNLSDENGFEFENAPTDEIMERVSDSRSSHDFAPSRRNSRGAMKESKLLGSRFAAKSERLRAASGPLSKAAYGRRGYGGSPDYYSWLNTLFPALSGARHKSLEPAKDPETWSPEALALSRSLLRLESLRKLDGGLELRRTSESFNPRWNRRESLNTDLTLYSPTAWLTRSLNPGTNVIVEYCNTKERGVFSLAMLLGRVRPSEKEESQTPPFDLYDLSLTPLHETRPGQIARVEPAGENRSKLILTVKDSTFEQHFTIDTTKHVLVIQETFDEGKVTGTTTFSDFVEVAGSWWAKKSTTTDSKGQKIGDTAWDVRALPVNQYQDRLTTELAALPRVQFIHLPVVKLKVARQKVADGSAAFDDRLVMIMHFAGLQQWDELFKQVEAIEKLAGDKPGVRWLRPLIQTTIRRNDEARLWYLDEAKRLVANPRPDELFVAEFILGQVYGITGWPEYLEFVQLLKPVYDRQPAERKAVATWQERLASCDYSLGRKEESLALRKILAEQTPWNLYAQTTYAQHLRNAGKVDEALAWLQREFDRKVERTEDEIRTLNSTFTEFYRTYARWEDLLKFTSQWKDRNPEDRTAYGEYLSALIFNNQLDQANRLVETWLKESQIEGKLPAASYTKLDVAVNFALGQIPHISVQRMQEQWISPLAEVARFFSHHKHHFEITVRTLDNHYFAQSDDSDRLRGEFLTRLQGDIANLNTQQLQSLVRWTISGRIELAQPMNGRKQLAASEVDIAIWKKIATSIQVRWGQAQEPQEKHELGETLISIYANRFAETEYLPFLRERIGTANAQFRPSYISALFEALLNASWTTEIEQEAFARLRDLSDAKEPVDRVLVLIPALHRLVDQMLANRTAQAAARLQDQGKTDQLTRQELAKKRAEIKLAVQQGVAERLTAEAAKEPQGSLLTPWIQLERAWLDVKRDQRIPEIVAECWKLIGDTPPQIAAEDTEDELAERLKPITELKLSYIESLLKERAFTTVLHLTVRRSAPAASVEQLLKFINLGIGYGGDQAASWRYLKFQVLVGLDRPDELERELREWIRLDVSTAPWRILLGHILAERGKFEEAIPLFEACEKDHLLSAADYRTLANWYQALNRRESYERARIEAYKQAPEDQLSNMLYHVQNRWNQTTIPLPSELDENTLFTFTALFAKSSQPERYLPLLRNFYVASRDFRLLQMIPDAALGRTPQQAYQFITSTHQQVLYELRNEAPADEILTRIKKLREAERTPTDLRALDLLEAIVERKSSEVLNQPGPHVEGCFAALQRAFQRKWAEGEPVPMASFLKDLGTLHHPKLVYEQLRELRELQKTATAGGRDHLLITNDLCHVLFYDYHRQDEALREMEAVATAYDRLHAGTWPHQDNEVLGHYVKLLEDAKRHATGEMLLQKYLAKPAHGEQSQWLKNRMLVLLNNALQNDGTVSLGSGQTLFQNLIVNAHDQLKQARDEHVRYNVINQMVHLFEIGRQKQFPTLAKAVSEFAFDLLPQTLKLQQSQYRNSVQAPIYLIRSVLGPRDALRYVVERMEQFPLWMDMEWSSSWNTLGYELGRCRQEAAEAKLDLNDLNPRVFKLAAKELTRELRTGESRNRVLYHRYANHYWVEKNAEFAQVANEIYAERKSSGRRAMSVAQYLWEGLERHPRAIEILFLTHQDGLLDHSGRVQLIHWLQLDRRFAESIPLLEPLIKEYPDAIQYRSQLMSGYFHSKRPEQLGELVDQTDKHFHQGGRWNESNIAAFALACKECGLTERSIGYFNEAIALHQRSHPGSGLGDATLSLQYRNLAEAHSTLGHTKEAVEAASAAVICWHARHEERVVTLNALAIVLEQAKDLDDYVKLLDADAAKTGQDSPLLRKMIGKTYQKQMRWDQAITQLQLAVTLQPTDKDIHKALMESFDAADPAKYKGAAVRQLLSLIDVERHDLSLYQQLAERLKGNEAEAERAATSIIEAAPNESENHAAMAELRQKQERWDEAIPHWDQVAKLRRLEPTGLLKLAAAQLHQKQWVAAKKSIDDLQRTEWPARFGDVRGQAQQLQQQLPKP